MGVNMASFYELIDEINNNISFNRDRGTAFEKMAVAYFKNEPIYKNKFSDVWLLKDVPKKYNIPKVDLGVDLVAVDRMTGKLTAIQAKFYRQQIRKGNIDSFIAELGKDYYSEGIIIATTDEWNRNAEAALEHLSKPVTRIGLTQLDSANIDWQKFNFDNDNIEINVKTSKKLRDYQHEIIDKAFTYFLSHSRGKLIMAPGTGKTFTSLKVAEYLFEKSENTVYRVLYLVPSIQLLSQTLFSWNCDVSNHIKLISFSVVSDRKATKSSSGEDDITARDIGFPATTNVEELLQNYNSLKFNHSRNMVVVFSTYQSIDVISEAQRRGFPEFDLVICDEAHRTTGAAQDGMESVFTKVHNNQLVKSKLRLYQTATPKVYGIESKKKAVSNSIEIASMDDENLYGQEIYRLGFGDAVNRGYLTDYKVVVLAVSEQYINRNMQTILADNNELNSNDIGKIIGVWNAMVKRNGMTGAITGKPMKRAIAFTDTIAHSKELSAEFNNVVNDYLGNQAKDSFSVQVHHVDGTLNALQKKQQLDWLAGKIENNNAHVLMNVRFLTEGIDVPNLDAVIFFSPKKSQVDIVQAVGRIMRKFEDKEYGYIILPIVVANNVDPSIVLDNNEQYKEVWQVLNALRATDERFEAEINKLELNKKKSGKINIIGTSTAPGKPVIEQGKSTTNSSTINAGHQTQLAFDDWNDMEKAFYGKIVQKVGNRRYLENWSKDVSEIAQRHIARINVLIDTNSGAKLAFEKFFDSIRNSVNNNISKQDAIEMLAQHLITSPIFDALFDGDSFIKNNPVSHALDSVISALSIFGFDKEQKQLTPFYESVKLRASGIDNAEAKQKIIISLYDKFFRTGFKDTTDKLGIVFTPIEIVDFIVKSVSYATKRYFKKDISDENVHILDPFTGTGTFIVRILEYLRKLTVQGVITQEELLRNYLHSLHANEILLLSYYIATINIETVFREIHNSQTMQEFPGIVLTDTFNLNSEQLNQVDTLLSKNVQRMQEQTTLPITVVLGNPPYSGRQSDGNDNNANNHYEKLDLRIEETYVKKSNSTASHAVYDSYVRAVRWATDRIGDSGIIAFVTSNSYIDGLSFDGVRKSLLEEFNYLYVLDLKGALRGKTKLDTQIEGENVFDIMTGVAIMVLVKDGSDQHVLKYCNIGDGLSRKEKFEELIQWESIENAPFLTIKTDDAGNWINQSVDIINGIDIINDDNSGVFNEKQLGINSKRDKWVYGFSKDYVKKNISAMIDVYNNDLDHYEKSGNLDFTLDKDKISWSDELKRNLKAKRRIIFNPNHIQVALYKPFTKKYLYLDKAVIARPGRWGDFGANKAILIPGLSNRRQFSAFVTNCIPDLNNMDAGAQSFTYFSCCNEKNRTFNINKLASIGLNEEDTFAYVYAMLLSPSYRKKYSSNLKKAFPVIPIVDDFNKIIQAGKKLLELHLEYEKCELYPYVDVSIKNNASYVVNKMKFGKNATGSVDKSIIIYNSDITIKNIPLEAYNYIINGRSAIEWVMDQYKISTDSKTGFVDNPNLFSDDERYIFCLLLKVITVSMNTLEILRDLPEV